MKHLLVFLFIYCTPQLLWGSPVDIFYNQTEKKLLIIDSFYGSHTDLENYRTGYPANAITLKFINNKDTVDVFSSFGCTQYVLSNNRKELLLYSWINEQGYASTDCICIDEDHEYCKPDTSEAILKFYFQFENTKLKLKISNFINPLQYTFAEDIDRIKEIVNSFDKNKLVSLSDIDNKNYDYTIRVTDFLINYYYSFSFYCLINDKLSVLESIDDFIIENYSILKANNDYNFIKIEYCQNLRKYVWANKEKTFLVSPNNFNILFKISKILSSPSPSLLY